jgi:hypothetical protein
MFDISILKAYVVSVHVWSAHLITKVIWMNSSCVWLKANSDDAALVSKDLAGAS